MENREDDSYFNYENNSNVQEAHDGHSLQGRLISEKSGNISNFKARLSK